MFSLTASSTLAKQNSFAQAEHDAKRKMTRRDHFLGEIEIVIPPAGAIASGLLTRGRPGSWAAADRLGVFLTYFSSWEVIGALNYLHHNHYDSLKLVAPYLSPDREPGSFYIKK